MSENIDKYIKNVIQKGDKGSDLLASLCAPTLKNNEFIEVITAGMQGLAVARFPEEFCCIAHSDAADPKIENPIMYTISLVERLVNQSKLIDASPIGFANVIDANLGDKKIVENIGKILVNEANKYNLAILNGELAILGKRVNCDANLSGTMISIDKKENFDELPIFFHKKGVRYFAFDPNGKAVYLNSDGVGTKTEFYERAENYSPALRDSLAMKADDANKVAADIQVIFDIVETKGDIPMNLLKKEALLLGRELGFEYILQQENVGNRIKGFSENSPSYNISGTAVSTIDEDRLKNPLTPKEGDYLIAIAGIPNPRSNGITDKRKLMVELFGKNWHKDKEGKEFLDYLATPSTILYPVFKELIDNDLVSAVYHMSGGAYNGKLARPLAKQGLYVEINNLFQPHKKEIEIMEKSNTNTTDAYSKWPMGNDGFVATSKPKEAKERIKKRGLKAEDAGRIKKCDKTGVDLIAFNGEGVYFPGTD